MTTKTKKLAQIVANERDVKTRAYKDISKEYTLLQKPQLAQGMQRTYTPKDDDGEKFPAESTHVQMRVEDALADVATRMRELFDLTLTKDSGNRGTHATIILDDQPFLSDVPAQTLLFFEKQLADVHAFLMKLPTLDPAERWTFDTSAGLHVTEPVETVKTKKIKKAIVLYPATDKHPAQTQLVDEDVIVGTWKTIKHSGAVTDDRKKLLLARCEKLQAAVKDALTEANSTTVEERRCGAEMFAYLFR